MLGFERLDMTIFERIKELADKQGKSLQKVSEDLGLSQNYIYNLKGAKSPAADKLALIADYFNVSVDYLLGRSNFKNDVRSDKDLNVEEILKFASDDFKGVANPFDIKTMQKLMYIRSFEKIYSNIDDEETITKFGQVSQNIANGTTLLKGKKELLNVWLDILVSISFLPDIALNSDNRELRFQGFGTIHSSQELIGIITQTLIKFTDQTSNKEI